MKRTVLFAGVVTFAIAGYLSLAPASDVTRDTGALPAEVAVLPQLVDGVPNLVPGVTVPSQFEVTLLASGLLGPKGLDSALNRAGVGPMGDDLFVAESGANQIVRVDKNGAGASFFANTMGSFPVGIGCYGGPFAQYMYVGNAMGSGVVQIDSSGNPTPFALPGKDIAGLDFGRGQYGHDMYAGEWAAGNIWRVDTMGNATLFSSIPSCETRYIKFSHGGTFGTWLYFTDYVAGDIYRVDPSGNPSIFASPGSMCLEGFDFSPGGVFGRFLYVGDVCSGDIFQVAADGTVNVWATGFPGVADIIFEPGGPGGFTMYLVDGQSSVFAVSKK